MFQCKEIDVYDKLLHAVEKRKVVISIDMTGVLTRYIVLICITTRKR